MLYAIVALLVIILDHEFLPYFFETGLLMTVPYPIDVIAPGCKVYDDGFGIYLGNGMMIHCGNPIQYASIDTTYWRAHFYCFGRLP